VFIGIREFEYRRLSCWSRKEIQFDGSGGTLFS